jgi:hypothetical protein
VRLPVVRPATEYIVSIKTIGLPNPALVNGKEYLNESNLLEPKTVDLTDQLYYILSEK